MKTVDRDPDVVDLSAILDRVLSLLRQIEPISTQGDITWQGPYFIDRGEWWPTHFVLYRGELYCAVHIGWSSPALVWKRAEQPALTFQGHTAWDFGWHNGPELWTKVLLQVEARLRSAIKNVVAYNARVARHFPARSRVGHIRRRWSWPKGTRAPLSKNRLGQVTTVLAEAGHLPALRDLTFERYLALAAKAYDATFPDLHDLTAFEKYARRADGRHGGLLELPPQDAAAFSTWFESRSWQGSHPWEIIFAHPHGVMLSPHLTDTGWRFYLSVGTLGLYALAVKMVLALGEERVPVELVRHNSVLAALRGDDQVEIGPFYGQLGFDELEARRPGAATKVAWDPLPVMLLARDGMTAEERT